MDGKQGTIATPRILEDYLERLQEVQDSVERTIQGLPQEALDWVPGPDMNPLGALVTHVIGAQRYWFGDVINRDPGERDRAAEFRARGLSAIDLSRRLEEALEYNRSVVGRLAVHDPGELRVSPRDGREFSVWWTLLYILEHTAIHLGHMQVTRQLWEQHLL